MKARRVADKHPTLRGVLHIPDGGAVAQRRDRQPEQLPEFDDLGDGPFGQPRADLLADQVAVAPAADLKTQLFNFFELRALDHRDEVEPLLAGDHGDPDVAVLGRLDRGDFGVRLIGGTRSNCECSHSLLCIAVIASSMDRSRCSPGPPCSTRRRTASAPNAA